MIKPLFVAGEVLITILMTCYLHYLKLFFVTSRDVLVSSLHFVQSEFIIYGIVLCKNIFLCDMILLVKNLLCWGKMYCTIMLQLNPTTRRISLLSPEAKAEPMPRCE